ncbi:hypothetical protein KEM60_01035 [Austwickia sp. TVS 96-490-7B]|uniref:DUF2625 family protein n=1 Tax=Austwickia sp. TVS 96-490-7B TaxID=2830843 RepID=UPI001C55BAB5|nr:DUF2625 family protein [Austwickia sp. TVS 96-490-7B]MBW3084846.1 hypothetical protein [Austwickia sp. TVS 96-490-7B]
MIGPQPAERLYSDDDAWPLVTSWAQQRHARILPGDPTGCADTLTALQTPTQTVLGALAGHCGGIVADGGWLRLLGGGQTATDTTAGLPSLAEINAIGGTGSTPVTPGAMVVAYDVLGGLFAVNAGGLPCAAGDIAYFGPDTLEWVGLDAGYAAFVEWALAVGLDDFAAELRWTGWQQEVAELPLDAGITAYPPPWSYEGRDLKRARRAAAPIAQIWASQATAARDLAR